MLELPSYQKLSKEQDAINNLPTTGTHLVVGPPGTGKTVMAVYRAKMCHGIQASTQFLVYNRPLSQYLMKATETVGVQGLSNTLHSWFWSWYLRNFNRAEPPTVPGNPQVFEWNAIRESLMARTTYKRYDHIIVDEGQDFPKDFYLVMQMVADNLTVFADENQRITETQCTIAELKGLLGVSKIHYLTRNYRNTRPIAEFAKEFYTGLPSGIPVLPEQTGGSKPLVLRYPTTANGKSPLSRQVEFIRRYAINHPDFDIAVIVHYKTQREDIARLLIAASPQPDHKIQVYRTKKDQQELGVPVEDLDFDNRTITVLTYASTKGLEFDAVFLPDLEHSGLSGDDPHHQMMLYVLTSRARHELFLMYAGAVFPVAIKHVPDSLYDSRDD